MTKDASPTPSASSSSASSPQLAENPPVSPGWWSLLTAIHSPGPSWPGALQASLSMALPAGAALLFGHSTEMLLITGGSFAVAYGVGRPFRSRWKVIAAAGALLSAGQMSGAFVGSVVWPQINAGGSHWWLLFIAIFVAMVSTGVVFVQNALRLPPPGGFFIVMVTGGATMVAKQGLNPVEVGSWALLGAAAALMVGMFPMLWGRHRPEIQAVDHLEKSITQYTASRSHTVAQTHQIETLLADTWYTLFDAHHVRGGETAETLADPGTPDRHVGNDLVRRTLTAHLLLARSNPGITRDTAAEVLTDTPNYLDLSRHTVPLPRPTMRYRLYRSFHRYSRATMSATKVLVACLTAGTVGIALGFDRPDWAVLSAMLVLQWGPERRVGTIRGLHRLIGSVVGVGVFALIYAIQVHDWSLLLTLALCQFFAELFVVKNYAFTVIAATSLALLMGDSMTLPLNEVIWARWGEIAVATIASLSVLWLYPRAAGITHVERQIDRAFEVMGALLGALLTTTSIKQTLPQRRDLQYELLSERRSSQSIALDSPTFAADNWPQHLAVQNLGYHILDRCTAAGDQTIPPEKLLHLSSLVQRARGTAIGSTQDA